MWVYVFALAAALLFGIGSVVQQRVAFEAPPGKSLRPSLLLWLVRQPVWLIGLGTALVGNFFSASALAAGSVAVVQPLLVSRLLFAVPLSAVWARQRMVLRDWLGMAAVAAGLGVFLVVGRPGAEQRPGTAILPWILTLLAAGIPLTFLVVMARRLRPTLEAPLLGAGAGILFGIQSGLMHTAVNRFTEGGLGDMLLTPMTYGVPFTAILGTLLAQSAYEMAPLTASYPTLAAVEPLAGIAVGIGVLGGTLAFGPGALAVQAVSLTVMTAGIFLLATSPLVTGSDETMQRRKAEEQAADVADDVARKLRKVRRGLDRGRQELAAEAHRRLVQELKAEMDGVDACLQTLSTINGQALEERETGVPEAQTAQPSAQHRELMERYRQELCQRQDQLHADARELARRVEELSG